LNLPFVLAKDSHAERGERETTGYELFNQEQASEPSGTLSAPPLGLAFHGYGFRRPRAVFRVQGGTLLAPPWGKGQKGARHPMEALHPYSQPCNPTPEPGIRKPQPSILNPTLKISFSRTPNSKPAPNGKGEGDLADADAREHLVFSSGFRVQGFGFRVLGPGFEALAEAFRFDGKGLDALSPRPMS